MTCIKTGARVLLSAYGRVVPADLHRTGDCIVIDYNVDCPFDAFSRDAATHVVTFVDDVNCYHNTSYGVLVVPDTWVMTNSRSNLSEEDILCTPL